MDQLYIGISPERSARLEEFDQTCSSNMLAFLEWLGTTWKAETQQNLSGTSTGQFPAYRTGRLHDSVDFSGPNQLGPGDFELILSVNEVYASIQEFGGYAGQNLAAFIPPRPYAYPALDEVWNRMSDPLADHIMKPLRQ